MLSPKVCANPARQPAGRRFQRLAAVALVLLLVALAGCGPVQSTSRISDAKVAFARARVVGAHNKAPFEYYTAQYYLHKANEEWGYSDFEAAYDYANRAEDAAQEAIIKAKEDPWPGSPVDQAKQRKALEAAEAENDPGPSGF